MTAPVRAAAGGIRLDLHVIPRASRTGLGGLRDGRIVVRVSAPPADGAANEAVREFLARTIGVPKGAVAVTAGLTSRRKTVEVRGATFETAVRALGLDD